MHCELSAEDDKPSTHLLDMLVSHNFREMVHGSKDILCKLNRLNKKLQTSGVTPVKGIVNATIAGLKREFIQTQDAAGNSAVLIEQEVNLAGGDCLRAFLLDIARQMNPQGMSQADTLQYTYIGLGEEHADAGNQFIPVRTSTSEHTRSSKLLMTFAEVVVQGLEQRFVDGNLWPSLVF